MEKSVNVTSTEDAKNKINDIEVFGDGDTFKLICKASSKSQGWMKFTKAMEISGVGCVVQVSTQQISKSGVKIFKYDDKGVLTGHFSDSEDAVTNSVAEAITFVPGVRITETRDGDKVVSRQLVKM